MDHDVKRPSALTFSLGWTDQKMTEEQKTEGQAQQRESPSEGHLDEDNPTIWTSR